MRRSFPAALVISMCAGLLLAALVPLLRSAVSPSDGLLVGAPASEISATATALPSAGEEAASQAASAPAAGLLGSLSGPLAALMGVLIGVGLCLMRRDLMNR